MGRSVAVLLVAMIMNCCTAFISPKMPLKLHAGVRLAASSQKDSVESAVAVKLGGGSEMMVARRRRRSSEEDSDEVEAQETTRVVEQYTPGTSRLEQRLRFAEENALPMAVGAFFIYKKLTTGTWLEWGMNRFDNSVSRRSSVQSESDLKKINVMSCGNCGYTIFPALGRTFRFDTYTKECKNCGAVGAFYDKNDPNDERNVNADGTSIIDERRAYMKEWINADKDKVEELRKEYKITTDALLRKGVLPTGLQKEIADKKQENKELGINDEDEGGASLEDKVQGSEARNTEKGASKKKKDKKDDDNDDLL